VLGAVALAHDDVVAGARQRRDGAVGHRHPAVRQHHRQVHHPADEGEPDADAPPPGLADDVGDEPRGDDRVARQHERMLDRRPSGDELHPRGHERQQGEPDAGRRRDGYGIVSIPTWMGAPAATHAAVRTPRVESRRRARDERMTRMEGLLVVVVVHQEEEVRVVIQNVGDRRLHAHVDRGAGGDPTGDEDAGGGGEAADGGGTDDAHAGSLGYAGVADVHKSSDVPR
jgi:hypothetical protein